MAKEEAKKDEILEEPVTGVNPKWLEGQKFYGETPKEVKEEGRKKTKFIPYERPLQPGDVLLIAGIVLGAGYYYWCGSFEACA